MEYIIMIGLPGSGKGTQSAILAEKCNFKHLSTGEILREEIAKGTKLGKIAEKLIHDGHFMPDDLTMELLASAIEHHQNNHDGFILDGFPRTIEQALAFREYIAEHQGNLLKVLCLDVPEPVALQRLLRRGVQKKRKDDNEKTAKKRIDIYYHHTFPLIDFYDQEDILAHVNGEDDINDVSDQIEKIVFEDKIKDYQV